MTLKTNQHNRLLLMIIAYIMGVIFLAPSHNLEILDNSTNWQALKDPQQDAHFPDMKHLKWVSQTHGQK